MPRRLALAFALLLAACSGKKPPAGTTTGTAVFPTLPRTPAEVTDLIEKETRRLPPPTEPELDAGAILAAAEARGLGTLPAGNVQILRWIQAGIQRTASDAYFLFGTYHDAPGQLDAFRRIVGPGGLRGLHVVAAEQFRADGEWQGAPIDAQRGDNPLLELWSMKGDRLAFEKLAERHRDGDYAAWKLGYEDAVLDLLVNARATGVRFVGCDMPAQLQELSGAPPGELRNRLREIHCLRSLPITWPRRAALIWGDAHVRRSGLVRFITSGAAVYVVHAFGQRQGGGTVEPALGKKLVVNDPVLVPLGEAEAALLLPDAILGGHVDRVLTTEGSAITTGVTVRSEVPGTFAASWVSAPVGREPVRVALEAGDHAYAFTAGDRRIVGALHLEAGHHVELGFDPEARLTSYVERAPR
ncbi:MAG: hypothetical protein QM820_47555 [Minicystis sp.]